MAFVFLAATLGFEMLQQEKLAADPEDARQVARGKAIYDQHCAVCHGARLEGQPNWQDKLPTGRMPGGWKN